MTTTRTASEMIIEEVGSWPGIEVDDGELGELAFKFGPRELGHLHGDAAAHFSHPLRAAVRALLPLDPGTVEIPT